MVFSKIKDKLFGSDDQPVEFQEDYIEVDTRRDIGPKAKILVRPFVIEEFSDIKPALDALREGYTIALVNIRVLKDKDLVELKRAINKLKKTCSAVEGDIAGFGEDWIVATPSFAKIFRNIETDELDDEI
jgi:SepF-like predicted cell division protein (DUF552 family)